MRRCRPGSFNERFALPSYSSFRPRGSRITDAEQKDGARRGGRQVKTPPPSSEGHLHQTPVEHWGQGRAAALTHNALDGARDLTADNVRSYLIDAHAEYRSRVPPPAGQGRRLATDPAG